MPRCNFVLKIDAILDTAIKKVKGAAMIKSISYEKEISDKLEKEISERDRSDSERTVGPLTSPADAERIDTSDMPFDHVVDALEAHVKRVLGARDASRRNLRPHRSGAL